MKKGTTVYFDVDIEEKLKAIPKSYKTKFINQVMREYFEKNASVEIKIEFKIPDKDKATKQISAVHNQKSNDNKSEDAF